VHERKNSLQSSPQQQFETFKLLLRDKRGLDVKSRIFGAVVTWLKMPLEMPAEYREEIKTLVCIAFNINEDELRQAILTAADPIPIEAPIGEVARIVERLITPSLDLTAIARRQEEELWKLIPREGFLHDYANYTRNSEAPLAYHVFCAIAGIAATVNRRVFFDMGNFRLFLPFGILILGPSGIKKTSAADIIIGIINEMQLTPVYAEKLTPEALIDAMKGGNATGLVYAPEMTVLISRQRYMESIIPLLTRFMDSPDLWKSGTIMRGKAVLTDVAITCIMCSTMDWFVKNTPESIFGGGFIARNVMILQEASARMKALPEPSDGRLREKLKIELACMHENQGEMILSDATRTTHIDWYEEDKKTRLVEHEILETYYQRKPQHLLRIAMCLHLSSCKDMIVCLACWERALKLLTWTEKFLPALAGKMFKTAWGEDQEIIIRKIRGAGGKIDHSDLIRKMQYKMAAAGTRNILSSLKEAGVIRETRSAIEHSYTLAEGYND
jgi:hypothetical protein